MVRHGETEDNICKIYSRDNTILSKKGIEEIKISKKILEEYTFDKVYYSPLTRTEETLKYLELDGTPEERIEEWDFGIFSGLNYREIEDKYPIEYKEWTDNPIDFIIREGESLEVVYKRVVEFLEELVENEEDVLLVTHGGVIGLAFCWVFDNIDYFFKFKIDNGSINIISIEDGYKFIKKSNLIPKLK